MYSYSLSLTLSMAISRSFSQIKTHGMTIILHLRNKRFVGTAQNWSTRRDTIVAPVIDWGEFQYIRSPKPTRSDWGGIAYNIVPCFTIYAHNIIICLYACDCFSSIQQ